MHQESVPGPAKRPRVFPGQRPVDLSDQLGPVAGRQPEMAAGQHDAHLLDGRTENDGRGEGAMMDKILLAGFGGQRTAVYGDHHGFVELGDSPRTGLARWRVPEH